MPQQLTDNAAALRLFLTEDIYLIKGELSQTIVSAVAEAEPIKSVENKVEIPSTEPVSKAFQEPIEPISKDWNFKFVGKNQKKILILVNDAANDVSTEEGREVLRKLVKAIELTGNDFALVNYAQYSGASFSDFKKFFKCEVLLSFGVDCASLKIPQSDIHKLVQHRNTRIVVTHRLDILDGPNKKMLWSSLQQLKS